MSRMAALSAIVLILASCKSAEAEPKVKITKIVYRAAYVDTSLPGYPSKASASVTFDADNQKDFGALTRELLKKTKFKNKISLEDFIAVERSGDREKMKELDVMRSPTRTGSSFSSSLTLYQNDDVLHSASVPRDYSGERFQALWNQMRKRIEGDLERQLKRYVRRSSRDLQPLSPSPLPVPLKPTKK